MDINELLNEIIFKYHLDRCYPHYRNIYEAEKILRELVQTIIKDHRKVIFVGNDKTGIEFIRNISGNYEWIQFLAYDKSKEISSQLETVDWKMYESIYLISYYGGEYAERWFRKYHLPYEGIYDIFEREGLSLQRAFYAFGKEDLFPVIAPGGVHTRNDWTESLQCELYCQQSKYYFINDQRAKHIALEKCLFLALIMKNFEAVQVYISLLSKEDMCYRQIGQEINNLLDLIKSFLMKKKQQDIIIYWLDAIRYGDELDMPYVQDIMKKSVVFENAYAYVANTHPMLRAMFLGKKDIEDFVFDVKKITRENSVLISFLEDEGYDIKIVSGYFYDAFPARYISEQFLADWYVPGSMVLWDMLSNMIRQEQKTVYVIHAMDAHNPYLSSGMNDHNYKNKNVRYQLAKKELDKQLAFYDSFVNDHVCRIYMSDHGRDEIDRHHVLLNIFKKDLKPGRVEKFFTFLDFNKLLRQLIKNGQIKEQEITSDYVEIGCLDRYSYRQLNNLFKNKEPLSTQFFGYMGIVDKRYIYLRYTTGKEWLQRITEISLYKPFLFYDSPNDICEPELLSHYRRLVRKYPANLLDDKYFEYSRYLYKLYNNILEHNNMPKRIEIINQVFTYYPENSVAVRTGGIASMMLYYILSKENRKKMWGIIDNDKECLCSKLQLPVVCSNDLEDLPQLGVKMILLPSYTYLKILQEEFNKIPTCLDVLDIYDVFLQNGLLCQEDFYKVSGSEEDYDVGFPLDREKY